MKTIQGFRQSNITYFKPFDPRLAPSPFQFHYISYHNELITFNIDAIKTTTNILEKKVQELNPPQNIAICVVGSDARKERCIVKEDESPELVVYGKDLTKEDLIKFQNIGTLEYKNLNSNQDLSQIHEIPNFLNDINTKTNSFPERVLDTLFLFGDYDIFVDSKRKFIEQIKISKIGSKVYDDIKKRVKNHKLALQGTQKFKRELVNYDLNEGISHYYTDPRGEFKIESFKQGPVRLIQLYLVKNILHKIREDYSKINTELLCHLPTSTEFRIHYLHHSGILNISKGESYNLIDHYQYFLQQYHRSMWNHYRPKDICSEDKTKIEFDKAEVTERITELEKIICPQIDA